MNTTILEDMKINVKIELSALWVTLVFLYTYADILGFYAPGNIEELISGEIAGIRMTQGLLLGSAILSETASFAFHLLIELVLGWFFIALSFRQARSS